MSPVQVSGSLETKLTDFFERTYVVNLPERVDRRRAITRELAKAGLPLTKAGKPNHRVELFPAIRPDHPEGFPSLGARGCFLSHLAILKQAQQDQLANVLILEDDLAISPRLQSAQASLIEQLDRTTWGFTYFGHRLPQTDSATVKLQQSTEPIETTHFYGVNGAILDRLIPFLEELMRRPGGHPEGGPMHIDGAYWRFRLQYPEVATFVAMPSLGWQRSSRSDITTAWFDQFPVLRQIGAVARTGKGWLQARRST